MQKYVQFIDNISEFFGKVVAWFSTAMVIIVCTDVLLRYLLNESSAWVVELEWHLFSLIFLFGAGYTLRHDRHVRVDVFYARFSDETKAFINLAGTILFLFPLCIIGIYSSWNYVLNSFLMNEVSADPNGLPFRYLIKACIPLGLFTLFLQASSLIISSLQIILKK